ncbi:MAG: KH domain-containing protein [Chloroflexi bacterium]|nr:KH domain-containing protein [Chloroflexota bacterium]
MKELVEFVAKSIAHNPEAVKVTEQQQDGQTVIQLEVAPEDKGRIIGKQGRVAQAMRVLLRVAAVKQGVRVTLEIV